MVNDLAIQTETLEVVQTPDQLGEGEIEKSGAILQLQELDRDRWQPVRGEKADRFVGLVQVPLMDTSPILVEEQSQLQQSAGTVVQKPTVVHEPS